MMIFIVGFLCFLGIANIFYYRNWVYRRPRVLDISGYTFRSNH